MKLLGYHRRIVVREYTALPAKGHMADSTHDSSVLSQIIEIGKIDVVIAGLQAQQKRIETDIASRHQAIAGYDQKRSIRVKLLDDKKSLVSREEKAIKSERDRINERRRALGTLNNYKVQQAAEKEIEFVSKQIGQREEVLLSVMREVENLEKEVNDLTSASTGGKDELTAYEKDSASTIASLSERLSQAQTERSAHISMIGANPALAVYNRVRNRYPMDPIATLMNRDSCSGCHMKLGPQPLVQVSRGEVVKCPGCSRILRLGDEQPAE